MAAAGAAIGIGMGIAGTAMSAGEAGKKRRAVEAMYNQWLPNIGGDIAAYYSDLQQYLPASTKLARGVAEADQATMMSLREKALPGFTKAQQESLPGIAALARGELPESVMSAYQRAGGASAVGSGMGGSGVGFLTQGLFGARGALGAIQLGSGLLSALLGSAAVPNAPSAGSFLSGVTTPAQRTNTQMQVRQQNIGIGSMLAGMKTGNEVWGGWLQETGGAMTGAGVTGMMGGMGGGTGSSSSSAADTAWKNYNLQLNQQGGWR